MAQISLAISEPSRIGSCFLNGLLERFKQNRSRYIAFHAGERGLQPASKSNEDATLKRRKRRAPAAAFLKTLKSNVQT